MIHPLRERQTYTHTLGRNVSCYEVEYCSSVPCPTSNSFLPLRGLFLHSFSQSFDDFKKEEKTSRSSKSRGGTHPRIQLYQSTHVAKLFRSGVVPSLRQVLSDWEVEGVSMSVISLVLLFTLSLHLVNHSCIGNIRSGQKVQVRTYRSGS